MRRPTVHIIGAGFSGLSAAIHLAVASNVDIIVHERGSQIGGRRRSFHDETAGTAVDGGGHLLSGGCRSTLATLDIIGARGQWREPESREIAFADMASGERWALRPNDGRWPWWVLSAKRRAPRTLARDYFRALKLRGAAPGAVVSDIVPAQGPAAERLWRPFCLAALNIEPSRASARLAAAVLGEAFAAGAQGARLLFPAHDFARAFIEPAERHLRKRGVGIRLERELRALGFAGDRLVRLEFESDGVDLAPGDAVVLAVPAWVASELVPGLSAPREFTATMTARFMISAPPGFPRALGIVNGPFPWLFRESDRVTVSARDAGESLQTPRDILAAEYWRAVASLTGLSDALPPWRIIRQKRAAFAATPAQDALRPSCRTTWRNMFLAGGYVQTGLPETIEGAVRSGEIAARWAAAAL
jgi:squalene-associated FAD-dependent desaturase